MSALLDVGERVKEVHIEGLTHLSPNAVVILYDPMQTAHGNIVLHRYRLTDEYLNYKNNSLNTYIDPANIFGEVPVKLTNWFEQY